MRRHTAIPAIVAALAISSASAEVVTYVSYVDTGTMVRPTDLVPFSNGFLEIQLDYDTETKEVVLASFQGFPRQVFTSDVDTIWNLSTGDETYILFFSGDGQQEVQLILEGDLDAGGRLDFALWDPASLAGGDLLQDTTTLLRLEARNWGTAYLSYPTIPSLAEFGGIRQADLDLVPSASFFIYADPIPQSCNSADGAEPFGVLDLGDVDAFVVAFSAGDNVADITAPFGVLDLADVDLFITSFSAGPMPQSRPRFSLVSIKTHTPYPATPRTPMYVKAAVSAVALSISSMSAEIIIYQSFQDDGNLVRATNQVPFSAGFFEALVLYDTEAEEVIGVEFSNFPFTTFATEFGHTILTSASDEGAYIYLRSSDNFHELQIVLEGDLAAGGRIDFVLYDPDALANGALLQDVSSLLTFGAPNWGTAYLSYPSIPAWREFGGPRQIDFDQFPGVSFFLYADPVSQSCNAADGAEPFGVLDLADIDAFVVAFSSSDNAADIAAPFGVLDLADIDAFIAGFFAGCP